MEEIDRLFEEYSTLTLNCECLDCQWRVPEFKKKLKQAMKRHASSELYLIVEGETYITSEDVFARITEIEDEIAKESDTLTEKEQRTDGK